MPCSLELSFCDHPSDRTSPQGARFCCSNSIDIAQLNASAQSLDDCSLQQVFEIAEDQHCDLSALRTGSLIGLP